MNITNFFLEFLIVFSIFACLTVITSTNPVIAILYLIGVFLNAAIYLIFIGLNFIGISYIIVYCGAILVLFLFVIMLLNIDLIDLTEISSQYTQNLPLLFTIAVLFSYLFFILIPIGDFKILPYLLNILTNLNLLFSDFSQDKFTIIETFNFLNFEQNLLALNQVEILGKNLYTSFSLIIIIVSLILLLALIVPILLLGKGTKN